MKRWMDKIFIGLFMGVLVVIMVSYLSPKNENMQSPISMAVQEMGHIWNSNETTENKLSQAKFWIEDNTSKSVPGFYTFLNINNFFREKTGTDVFFRGGTIIKLDNDYMSFVYSYTLNTQWMAEKVINLKNHIEGQGVEVLYLQAPFKISPNDSVGTVDDFFTIDSMNRNADDLLSDLEGQVEYIDFRVEIEKEGFEHYSQFFKTDHHWKPETGLWAAKLTMEYLEANYEIEVPDDLYQIESYVVDRYEDYFLGTEGRYVGHWVSGVDDFSLIYPKFETNMTYFAPNKGIERSGSFEEILLDYSHLEKKIPYDDSAYSVYDTDTYYVNRVVNYNAPNDAKILLIRDSFGTVYSPFLALGCAQLDIINLLGNSETCIYSYVEETKPDFVIFLYNPSSLGEEAFRFGLE